MDHRFLLQDAQYEFPYHYLPHFDERGTPRRARYLKWGFEYLCYQAHIADIAMEEAVDSALEVGCGDGFFIGSLGSGVRTRVGIDLSEAAIRHARAFHPAVRFEVGGIAEVEGQFDLVAAIEVLEHIPDGEVGGFLREVWARVAPGGRLILSVPTKVVPCHKKHYRHYDLEMLSNSLGEAGIEGVMERVDHVYAPSRSIDWLMRVSCNRYISIEIAALNSLVWRHIWRTRSTDAERGRHLVGVVRRPPLGSGLAESQLD